MSEDSILEAFREDFTLFIEAGFVAVKQLDEIAARRLFKAAELLNPDNLASQLGLGYVALNKLQVNEATKIFEGILKKDPEHNLAKALLAVAYLLTKNKREKGKELLMQAKAHSDDPSIQQLVSTCMDWAQTDLEAKAFSPLASKKQEQK